MNRELGPRTLGDIISETFNLYGKGFLTFAAIVVVPEVILFILSAVIFIPIIFVSGFDWDAGTSPYFFGSEFELGVSIGLFILLVLVFIIVSILVNALMQGALVQAVSEQAARETSNFSRAYGAAWKRIGNIIGASLIVGVVVIALAITIIGIPFAIYFGIRWAFVIQAVLVEGAGATEALTRSSTIVEGNWWRVFGILLVVVLIAWVISFALSFIPVVGSIIGTIIATPIAVAAHTLLYYDLRHREKGYTTEELARELGI